MTLLLKNPFNSQLTYYITNPNTSLSYPELVIAKEIFILSDQISCYHCEDKVFDRVTYKYWKISMTIKITLLIEYVLFKVVLSIFSMSDIPMFLLSGGIMTIYGHEVVRLIRIAAAARMRRVEYMPASHFTSSKVKCFAMNTLYEIEG